MTTTPNPTSRDSLEGIPADLLQRLLDNGAASAADPEGCDYQPIVFASLPDSPAIWLLTEADPSDPRRLFGVADLTGSTTEMGAIWWPALQEWGAVIDLDWTPRTNLTGYWSHSVDLHAANLREAERCVCAGGCQPDWKDPQ